MNKRTVLSGRAALALGGVLLLAITTACSSSSSGGSGGSKSSAPPATSNPAAGSGSTAATAGAPYVIGQLGTFSGPYGGGDLGAKDGVDAWVKYTNAHGGINGHPVKVMVKDDQLNAALALTEVKELISSHVMAIVGIDSIVEDSIVPYISSGTTPVIGDDLAKNIMGVAKNFYPEGTTAEALYNYGLPAVANLLGTKKLGVIYCAESSACSQIAVGIKATAPTAGVTFVYSGGASATATSYTAQCLAAKSAGANAVAMALTEGIVARVAQGCAQQNFHPQFLQGANGFTGSEADEPSLDGVGGPVNTFPWFSSETPAQQAFQAAMKQYEPQDFKSGSTGYSQAASNGWASAAIFGAAAAGLSGASPAGSDVIDQLTKLPKNNTFGGLTPPISYGPPGVQPKVKCFFAIQLKNKQYGSLNGGKTMCQP